MSKARMIYGGISVVIVISLVLGAGLLGYFHIPSVNDQVANKSNLTVRIINPPSDGRYPADAAIPFLAMAQGAKTITGFEYWVDGRLVNAEPPAPGNSPVFVVQTWRWMPIVEGEHLVTIRARDEEGKVAVSNIVRVYAEKAAGYRILHTSKEGDTWDTLAESCKTSAEAIQQQNPQLDSTQPLPSGKQVWIPCDPLIPSVPPSGGSTPPLSEGGPSSSPEAPPDKLGLWLNPGSGGLPKAPALKAGLNGCTVHLVIQDNSQDEEGFIVYRSGASNFERLATLGSNKKASFSYDDPVQASGALQYYVSSFNSAGEAQSDIVPVQVADGTCGGSDGASDPNLQYINGILSVAPGTELAYLYTSLDDGPWHRLPEGDEFFTPTGGKLDLSGYLEPLLKAYPQARIADLDVWGWVGGEVKDLGPLTITLDRTSLEYCILSPAPCSGDVAGTMWTKEDGVVGSNQEIDAQELTFQYEATAPGANFALVQISSQPFTSDYEPNPPFLVDAYLTIPDYFTETFITGEFKVQFSFFNQGQGSSQYLIGPNTNFWNFLSPNPPANPSPFASNLIQQMNQQAFGSYFQNVLPAPVYYIRVIPWYNDHPVGKASNTIAITYKPVEPTPIEIIAKQPSLLDIKIVDFIGEQQIIPENFGCVTITGVDDAKLRAWIAAQLPAMFQMEDMINQIFAKIRAQLPVGQVVCPPNAPLDDSSAWSDPWGAITSAWNAIVDTFNQLKNGIVYVMANVVQVFTGSCEQTCQSRLMTGLNLAITYFTGIPPNLPTSDELVDMGMNYAIRAAMEEAGIPCDDQCMAQMNDALKATKDAIKQAGSQPGCVAGGRYGKQAMCLPDGITAEPIQGASYEPPVVQVQVTRTNYAVIGSAQQFDYSLKVSSLLDQAALVGGKYQCPYGFYRDSSGYYQGHVPLPVPYPAQGSVYDEVILPLPSNSDPGTQFTLPVILKIQKNSNYVYQPFQDAAAQSTDTNKFLAGAVQPCSASLLTAPGYKITVTAELICTNRSTHQQEPCPPAEGATTQDTKQYTPSNVLQGAIVPGE